MNRITALARAEGRQFFRNPLLVSMMPLPVALAVFMAKMIDSPLGIALAAGMFVLFSLGFVVYYSALSMATTRRDERVLKRLRTGEAHDWEILTAIALPLGLMVIVLTPITVVLMSLIAGADLPANPLYMAASVLLGVPFSYGLALLTSRFTKNAEAAAITSFPVLLVSMASLPGGIRELLRAQSELVAALVDWNPFALAIDLFVHGWIGETVDRPLLTLAALTAWTLVLTGAGIRWMRWDTHR
ncbi:ABC transporter permease [Corynebacterium sp. LK2510]|uniref:ABC transporter permease n=1 Tax=Corynebacterium sp. LK2510 TaxID=3110472 RepID=UPI0034CF76FC